MGSAMLINCIHHQERNVKEDAMNFRAANKLISTVFFSQNSLYEKDANPSPFIPETVAKSNIAKYLFMSQRQRMLVWSNQIMRCQHWYLWCNTSSGTGNRDPCLSKVPLKNMKSQ